ncbi:MAG: hypothetical protein M3P82_00120, partial [Bacteroidota bacterium]|nr:hypothetical protein [Bacteroidota bacterium]
MIDKMNLASRQQNDLQLLNEQLNKPKDTVIIREKVVESPPSSTINEASPDPDKEVSREYISKVESLVSKFESQYQSALKSEVESKKVYLKYMDSLYNEFNKISSSKDVSNREINRLTASWMQKRENLINRLMADKSGTESSTTRSLREEGD